MIENLFYANAVGVAISQVDCCLRFDTILPSNFKTNNHITHSNAADSYNVLLSVEYAKKLSQMLNKQLAVYEEIYGPIKDVDKISQLSQTTIMGIEDDKKTKK